MFIKRPENFVVVEIPLYKFSGNGEHLILKVRKKNLTTHQMLKIISEQIGVKLSDIGYAGLKDKDAMTIQYISIPAKFEINLTNLKHEQIKILELTKHTNKLKLGHLRANSFFVRLKKVSKIDAFKLKEVLEIINQNGFPNYFGYQRFGIEQNNFEIGKKICDIKKPKKMDRFFINAYQSFLFNNWLAKRVELSNLISKLSLKECISILKMESKEIDELKKQPHPFKLLKGDLLHHYPLGKLFYIQDLAKESIRFNNHEIVPTGLLCGIKTKLAQNIAYEIEKEYIDQNIKIHGDRRYAWVFIEDLEYKYDENKAWFELNFTLPKGSYATTLLEIASNKDLIDTNKLEQE